MSHAPQFDLLLELIDKIEAVSDWVQSPPIFGKMFNYSIFVLTGAAIIWGTFFVPGDILLTSSAARSWVDVATTLFPWIAELEVNWGKAAHKQVYLQSVFILAGLFPIAMDMLSSWKVRVGHKKFLKKLDNQIIGGVFALLPFLFLVFNDMEAVDHSGIHQQKAFRLFMLNPHFSAIGAMMWASGSLYFFFVFSISLLYLIHYLRLQIKQLLGQYHG